VNAPERETQELWPSRGALKRTERAESADMLAVLLEALAALEERERQRNEFRTLSTSSRMEFAGERIRIVEAWSAGVRVLRGERAEPREVQRG